MTRAVSRVQRWEWTEKMVCLPNMRGQILLASRVRPLHPPRTCEVPALEGLREQLEELKHRTV